MRALPALLAIALLATPLAASAAIETPEGRIAEAAVAEALALYRIPVAFRETGYVYAKVLTTDGNAVHDGRAANGSVEDERGWRVAFALERKDGAREELGTFADGTMSRLAFVTRDEPGTLEARVTVPADAALHGGTQKVYVVLAFRPGEEGAPPGMTSGAQMDEARALTLLVHLDPAALGSVPPAPGAGDDDVVPPVEELPADDAPPAQPQTVVLQHAGVPTWALVLGVLALWVGALALVTIAVVLVAHHRDARRAAEAAAEPRRIPVRSDEVADEADARPRTGPRR